MRLVGIDVGGTFTDLILADIAEDRIFTHKVPTTREDPSNGAMDGLRQLCARHDIDLASISHVFHGTTIATNALLEHDGARTGLITTEGFRDILHIGRHQRPENYSIMQEIPWQDRPLILRRHRKTVRERLVPPRGEVLEPLDEEGVRTAARALKAEGVAAVAVCFLFSYLSPRHEERAKAILLEEIPEAFVSTSAGVAPQFREFERFTTAAINVFVGPKVRDYVRNFTTALREADIHAPLHIMGSHGGVATSATVADFPVVTLLSGPAAGVLGGIWAGESSGQTRLITFDVGGTSADIGILADGQMSQASARDTRVAGYPLLVPMIDLETIGTGGGSIAQIDSGGALRVGPASAGSEPGPAAYGKGGDRPTVTDANLVLGRLDADNFLNGEMTLDRRAAHTVIAGLASALGLNEIEAAEGVIAIANHDMANAIRAQTVQRGLDPRKFALVAFGGAGPLHGAEVAEILDIPRVIVPPHPGITSAAGLLTTDLKYDRVKTAFQVQGEIDLVQLNTDFAALEKVLLEQYAEDGVDGEDVSLQRSGDLRYVGQGYELWAPFADGLLSEESLANTWVAFKQHHKEEYGHVFENSCIEIVNIRVSGVSPMPKLAHPSSTAGGQLEGARLRTQPCNFRCDGVSRRFDTFVYRRDLLPVGTTFQGPAIIVQPDSTTVVPPGWRCAVERNCNLSLSKGGVG